MLKKIKVEQLILGMHLKEFCGSWMDHPFFRTAFVLTDPQDIETIRASSIKEVWIDASKGLDVASYEASVSQEESDTKVEQVLTKVNTWPRKLEKVSADIEIQNASKIFSSSKQAVYSMFEEARMGNMVDVGGAHQLVQDISDSVSRNPGAIISLARLKTIDDYTYMHSVAVCAMMVGLAKNLGMDEEQTQQAGVAGLLHDLGKANMPMDVLNKPGKLTNEEFNIIKSHPVEGHKMLRENPSIPPAVLDVCLHHHEKVDGSGYPHGLKDDQISIFAKMGAVCDVYDAITSNRPYKLGWDPAESLRKMAEWTQGHFHPPVFQAFVKSLGIYPIGSLVRLASGRIGVVVDQTPKSLTTPKVKVFFSTKSNMRVMPFIVDLSSNDSTDKIVSREDPAQWKFKDLNQLWSGLPGHI